MKSALVTGGAGFIGSHITDALLAAGYRVHVLDNLSYGSRKNLDRRAALTVADVRSPRATKMVAKGRYDVIIHAAAQKSVRVSMDDPVEDADVNVLGTINIARAAVGHCRRLVLLSTGGAMYGSGAKPPTPESVNPAPESPYGLSKFVAERYLRFFNGHKGLSTISLRLANVYGPRQDPKGEAGVVAIFSHLMHAGTAVTVYGDGRNTRDYLYVGDVATAVRSAIRSRATGEFNIGTKQETSTNELYRRMNQLMDRPVPKKHAPPRDGEQRRSALNCSRARRILRWKAAIRLDDGLRRTLASFAPKA